MIDIPSVSPEIKREALDVSREILKSIEESEVTLSNIALKAIRLARLLDDSDYLNIFEYEVNGYPSSKNGVPKEVWKLAVIAKRTFKENDDKTGLEEEYAYLESLKQMEDELADVRTQCEKLPPQSRFGSIMVDTIGISTQGFLVRAERQRLSERLGSRKLFIHDYASKIYYETKFSSVTNDAFSRIQKRVDSRIDQLVPNAVERFSIIYDYLKSDSKEHWSDAVHDCRRILKDLADALFPIQSEPRIKVVKGKKIEISLNGENYINRLVCFIADNSKSERFNELVGSHLEFIGNRLDSIYHAANKGSHTDITSREEADRCVVYTYMVVGDILSLLS